MLLIGREWQLSAFSFKPALHLEGCVFLRKCLTLPMQVSNNTFWETVCYLFFVLRTSPWSSSMSPTLSAQKMKFHLPKLQVSLPCSTPPSSRYSFCRMCSTCFSPDFFKYSFISSIYLHLAVLGLCCHKPAFLCFRWAGGTHQSWCTGFSLKWLLWLSSTGSRAQGLVAVHGLNSFGPQALEHKLSSSGEGA